MSIITLDGELPWDEESSAGEVEPVVGGPWPGSTDPSLLDLESAIMAHSRLRSDDQLPFSTA